MSIRRLLCGLCLCRLATIVSIVLVAFVMTILWHSSTVQLLCQFASERSATSLQLAALQAANMLRDLHLPRSPPAADESSEENSKAAGEENIVTAKRRRCF